MDRGSVAMATRPPAVALKSVDLVLGGELMSGGRRKSTHEAGVAQVLTTPTGPLHRGKWGQLWLCSRMLGAGSWAGNPLC
jgi:hypothetical protein